MNIAEKYSYALCDLLSEAYIHYAISIHLRPIYRHIDGDIGLQRRFLTNLIESHLGERFSPEKRYRMYQRLLAPARDCSDQLFCMGRTPELTARGIRFMNLAVKALADGMINEAELKRLESLISAYSTEGYGDDESRVFH